MKMYVNKWGNLFYFVKSGVVMYNDEPKEEFAVLSVMSLEEFRERINQGLLTEIDPEKSRRDFWIQVALVATIAAVAVGVIFL